MVKYPYLLPIVLISFTEYFQTANELEYLFNKNDTIEEFFEDVSAAGMSVSTVSTSDIAVNVLPLGFLKRKTPIRYEEIKKSKQASKFIEENLDKYKSLYKKNAESVLYSVAEHLFLKK